MFHVKAHIKLYEGKNYRQTPFTDGYRPLFKFIPNMMKSGQIKLINRNTFKPGEHGLVEISFLDDNYLGPDFRTGKKFTFGEGSHVLGEGQIVDYDKC